MTNRDIVLYLKAMADETRLAILEMLSQEELCACHILEAFDITQPTLSYHMRILVESGLVDSKKDGTWTRYNINPQAMTSFNAKVSEFNVEGKSIGQRCTDS